MNVICYTADVGGYDDEWPPVDQSVPVVWRRCTGGHPGWCDGRLAGRWYKTHPHCLFRDADVTIWVDACLEIVSPSFAADVVDQLGDGDYAVIGHPDRSNIDDEVEAADTLTKYRGNRHAEMVATCDDEFGRPDQPVVAMTMLARRNTGTAKAVDRFVWTNTAAWSTPTAVALDQLILPYALHLFGVRPVLLQPPGGGSLWDNDWFVRHPHRRET